MRHRIILALLISLLLPWAAESATYWVATNGDDSRSCATAQAEATPKRTLNSGRACLAAGDTLKVKPGNYNETLTNPMPSGLSASQPTTIEGSDTTQRFTIRPTGTTADIVLFNSNRSNIRMRHFIIDVSAHTGAPHNAIVASNTTTLPGLTLEHFELIGKTGSSSTAAAIAIGRLTVATVRHCKVHGWRSPESNPGAHGFYWRGNDGLLEHCEVYDNNGFGIQVFVSPADGDGSRNTLRYNYFRDNDIAGIYIGTGTGNRAYGNIVSSNDDGIRVRGTDTKVYNNTIVNNPTRGLEIGSVVNAFIKNNIIHGNGSQVSGGSGVTFGNNLCGASGTGCAVVGNPLLVNAAGGDFSLQATSPAINAGTASIASGITLTDCVGGCDIGALETFVLASAEVPDTASDNTIVMNFSVSRLPLLPDVSCTGFTTRVNTTPRTVTGCTRTGNGQVTLTLASGVTAGQTVDVSYSSGNVTDSALIGGTKNQRLNGFTNQPVTNKAGGVTAPVITQVHYKICPIDMPEGADCWPEDTPGKLPPRGCARVRLGLGFATASMNLQSWPMSYRVNGGGGFVPLTNDPTQPVYFTADRSHSFGKLTSSIAGKTLSLDGRTFATGGSFYTGTGAEFPPVGAVPGEQVEWEGAFCLGSDLVMGDYVEFQQTAASGATITYTQTARVDVVAPFARCVMECF